LTFIKAMALFLLSSPTRKKDIVPNKAGQVGVIDGIIQMMNQQLGSAAGVFSIEINL